MALSYALKPELSAASRGQHTSATQSEPDGQPCTPSSQHEPPGAMHFGTPFWQQSSPAAHAKPPGQHFTWPLNTWPPQQVTSSTPSRHCSPHSARHVHRATSMLHEPPMQLQASPVLALTMHEVSWPLVSHDAVRVN